MKLFRFCRQSLTALPVFFLFMACDQLLPPSGSGSGELVPVKIRSVSVRDYGEASATRSAGGEKRIIGEPIVQDLGGGMFAEITVEEDVSALRDGDTYLADTVKFRVIAVDGNGKVYSYGDYKVEEGALVLTNNTNFHVLKDVDYDYIFISFNNSTLPPPPTEGEALPATITVTAGANDLLYKRITSQNTQDITLVDGVPVLKFNDLKHKLARVKLVLDANTGRTITNVTAGSITLNAASSFKFNLTDGAFSDPSGTTNFSGWANFNEQKVTSNTSTFLESTAARTFSFAAGAVTLWDGATSKSTTAGSISSDNFTFEAGSSYTVTLKISRLPDFAGSNIYWDSANSRLTFDEYGVTGKEKYQGVYFKWGSLIGVSPVGTYSASSTVLYKPTNPSASAGKTRTWTTTTGTSNNPAWSNWEAIPYVTVSFSPYSKSDRTLLNNADFTAYKGDICNYINPAYRMPTGNELDAFLFSYTYTTPPGATSIITSSDATGRQVFTNNSGAFTKTGTTYYLPSSGARNVYDEYDEDGVNHVGTIGFYWSGSQWGNNSLRAYYMGFGGSNISFVAHDLKRTCGMPVRCVKIEN